MDSPLVSVIIPMYNRANLVEETLNSIVEQSYENWECVIVDDGSTDNSYAIAKQFEKHDSRFRVIQRPETVQKGANVCRNLGFKLSKGYLIHWFDSDDLMLPGMLMKKVDQFKLNPEIDLAFCDWSIFYPAESKKPNFYYTAVKGEFESIFQGFIEKKLKIITCSPLWKRELISGFPLFDEDLHWQDEYEAFGRFLTRANSFAYINESLVLKRAHDGSITKGYFRGDRQKMHSGLLGKKRMFELAIKKDCLSELALDHFLRTNTTLLKLARHHRFTRLVFMVYWFEVQIILRQEKPIKDKLYKLLMRLIFLVTGRGGKYLKLTIS